ncbi:hypothetical protein BFW38_06995 [Terasakiispira papahanaumokuakeensis]|uniref:Branched-chain amino acid transporter n=1 Tax=Terasakiispira papahanaumokuakeensis TaxID=197479 RepID=A0A1E2V8N6_9GAMM|nr:AzlD domain-containing protein [Terasakiispira papahanaumokuakeensis]ODC03334.1 hypothetical protein BFW38_06995 [Terasakiispira papahanaumokuakeensis]
MNVLTIILMAVLVFLSRYLFLEPKLPVNLSPYMQRLLSYAAPALLAAVIGPIIFVHTHGVNLSVQNPYLWAGLCTVILIMLTKRILLTTTLGFICFIGFKWALTLSSQTL